MVVSWSVPPVRQALLHVWEPCCWLCGPLELWDLGEGPSHQWVCSSLSWAVFFCLKATLSGISTGTPALI